VEGKLLELNDAITAMNQRDKRGYIGPEYQHLHGLVREVFTEVERLTAESATWKNYADQEIARLTTDLNIQMERQQRMVFKSDYDADVKKLTDLIREANEYLNTNKLTNIGHGSILHQKLAEAVRPPSHDFFSRESEAMLAGSYDCKWSILEDQSTFTHFTSCGEYIRVKIVPSVGCACPVCGKQVVLAKPV